MWPALLHVVKRTSVSFSSLPPRFTLTLHIHDLSQRTNFLSAWSLESNHIATYIHYKYTGSHSYLNFSSSHPYSCKSSIPYSQFLRPHKICSDETDVDIEAAKMETFCALRGYPNNLIRRGRERASTKSRDEILKSDVANNNANDRVPFVTTFHPS